MKRILVWDDGAWAELRRVADEYSSYEVTDPADRLRALAEDIEADTAEFDVTTRHRGGFS